MEDIIISTMDLPENYEVEQVSVDHINHEIIVLVSSKDDEFTCPDCDAICSVHDRITKRWRHVDFGDYKVFIKYRTPRVKCEEHGVKLKAVEWAKPRHAFTKTMEEFIYELSQKIPLVHVGKVVGEHDTRIKRVVDNIKKEDK